MDDRQTSPGFFTLPREIRDQIYEELLVHTGPIFVDTLWARPGSLCFTSNGRLLPISPGILRLNRQAHREACEVLYGRNRLHVENTANFARFLAEVGAPNAALLRHVVVPFPYFDTAGLAGAGAGAGEVPRPRGDSVGARALDLVGDHCPGVVTVETSLFSGNLVETRLDAAGHPRAVGQALALFEDKLAAAPSFRRLRVHLAEKPVSPAFRDALLVCPCVTIVACGK